MKRIIVFSLILSLIFTLTSLVYANSSENNINVTEDIKIENLSKSIKTSSVIEEVYQEIPQLENKNTVTEDVYSVIPSIDTLLNSLSQTSDEVWKEIKQLRSEGKINEANQLKNQWKEVKKQFLQEMKNNNTNSNQSTKNANTLNSLNKEPAPKLDVVLTKFKTNHLKSK